MKPALTFFATLVLSAALSIGASQAQAPDASQQRATTATAPSPGVAPPPAPVPPPGPPMEERETPISIDAKVDRYLVNPFGEVDGLLLDNKSIARMPPHMSTELIAAVKPGDAVSIQGRSEGATNIDAFSVTNASTKTVVMRRDRAWTDIRIPDRLRRYGLQQLNVSGKVLTMLTGRRGEPNGVLLENGTIVKIGPREAYAFAALLKPGAEIAASGYGTENSYGRAIEATAVGAKPDALQPLFR